MVSIFQNSTLSLYQQSASVDAEANDAIVKVDAINDELPARDHPARDGDEPQQHHAPMKPQLD